MDKERKGHISLLITTKDKPENVDRLLGSLQDFGYLERSDFTPVVVDSSKAIDTRRATLSYPSEYFEAKGMGKSTAMNLAINRLKSEHIAFLDDDIVIINAQWLDQLMSNFTVENTAYVSGRVIAHEAKTDAQRRWEEKGALDKGTQRIEVGEEFFKKTRARGVPVELVTMGANHVVKRKVLREIGAHDERFGPGQPISGAGADLDLTYKILRHDYVVVYDPKAVVAHNHPQSVGELRTKLLGYGISDTAIHTKFWLEYGDMRSAFQLAYRPGQNFTRLAKSLVGKYPLHPSVIVSGIAGNLIGPLMYFRHRRYAASSTKS